VKTPLSVVLLASALIAGLPVLGAAQILWDVSHLRAVVTMGHAVVLIEPSFGTGAILLGVGVALVVVVLVALFKRPMVVFGPLAAVAILVGILANFEAKSAALNYVRGAGYQRCEARDEARKGKRGYVMAEAWAKPKACGPLTARG
jgi:hypothetical protein